MLDVIQWNQEFLAGFLDFLHKAYREFISFDPYAPKKQQAVNIAFMTLLPICVHTKLQKLERFEGMKAMVAGNSSKDFKQKRLRGKKKDKETSLSNDSYFLSRGE